MKRPKCVNCGLALVHLRRKTRAGTYYWDHLNWLPRRCTDPRPRPEDDPIGTYQEPSAPIRSPNTEESE